MKKTLLYLTLFLSAGNLHATIRTVNNNGGAQYTTINNAVLAAASGDTIYICGSTSQYIAPTTAKANLTFIGTGFNVQKQNPLKSTIASQFLLGNNNILIGLELIGQVQYYSGNTGLTFRRCYILGPMYPTVVNGYCNNMVIDQCIMVSGPFSTNQFGTLIITNSLFFTVNSNAFSSGILYMANVNINNCTFVNSTTTPSILLFPYTTPITNGINISNCIFWRVNPNLVTSVSYFNNYSSNANLNNYGTGNITSSTWPFIQSQASVNTTWSYNYNFGILTSSLAHNAGNDGTDLGIYGGTTPYLVTGEPPIPQIDSMLIIGTHFTPGATMNLQFKTVTGN